MSSEYTGTATWHATVTLPSDGDQRNAASINQANEDLADRENYLYQYAWPKPDSALVGYAGINAWSSAIPLAASGDPRYLSGLDTALKSLCDRTVYNADNCFNVRSGETLTIYTGGALVLTGTATQTVNSGTAIDVQSGGAVKLQSGGEVQYPTNFGGRTHIFPAAPVYADVGPAWAAVGGLGPTIAYQQAVLGAKVLILDTRNLPRGAHITAVTAHVVGYSGHTALPSPLPYVARCTMDDMGVLTIADYQPDASADVTAYQTWHDIAVPCTAVNSGNPMFVAVVGEGTTNGVAGLQVSKVWIDWYVDKLEPGVTP